MPSPYANVGGGPGGPDDSFLGLDSGNFWSRFGLPEPGGPPPIDSASPMGPVDPMPNSQTPMTELEPIMPDPMETGAPLDAMYSMIGMPPLTADSMGRYNLTDDQKSSASRNSFANTLGTAAQVMFGTASADDMVKAGLSYGINRDAALDRSSATNKADYETKVEMAVKGSNLMRQQVLVEAEQEKLKEIMEQKEYGAEWVSTMEPVWEKYANELAVGDPSKGIKADPDRAQQYAAALQMVRAKAKTGDMSAATQLFDAASNEMIPSVWKKNQEEDMVKAQFARAAEFTGFKEADEALRAVMPDWRMGMKDGKAVPMSPADQQRERNAIDVLSAQAQNYREVSSNSSMQNQILRSTLSEQKRIDDLARSGSGALIEAFAIMGAESTGKPADTKARADAQGKIQEYTTYLQAAGALSGNQSNWENEIKTLAQSPQALYNAIANGAMKTSPVLRQLAPQMAGSGIAQGGFAPPAVTAGSGGAPNIAVLTDGVMKGIMSIGTPGGGTQQEVMRTISMIPDEGTQRELMTALMDKLAGKPVKMVRPVGSQGAYRTTGSQSAQ